MNKKSFLSFIMTLILVFNTFSCILPLNASANDTIDAFAKPISFLDCDETDAKKTSTYLTDTARGKYVLFKNVDFGDGAVLMTLNFTWPEDFTAPQYPNFYLNMYIDDKAKSAPDFKAQIYSKHTSNWEEYKDLEIVVPPEIFNGTHDLYIVFNARSNTAGFYKTISFADKVCKFDVLGLTLKDGGGFPVENAEEAATVTADTKFTYKANNGMFLKYAFFFYDDNKNYLGSTVVDSDNEYNDAIDEVFSATVDVLPNTASVAAIVSDSNGHIYQKGGSGYNFDASTDKEITELTVTQSGYGFTFGGVCADDGCDTVIAAVKNADGKYIYAAPLTFNNGAFESSFSMPAGAASIKDGLTLYIYENGNISAQKTFSYKNPDEVKGAIEALTKEGADIEQVLNDYKDKFELSDELLNNINSSNNKNWIYKTIGDRTAYLTEDANFADFANNTEKIYLLSVLMSEDDCYTVIKNNKDKLVSEGNANFAKYFDELNKDKFNIAFKASEYVGADNYFEKAETAIEQSMAVALISQQSDAANVKAIIDEFLNVLDFEQLNNYKTYFTDEQKDEVCVYLLNGDITSYSLFKSGFDKKAGEIYEKLLANTVDAKKGITLAKYDETSAKDISTSGGYVPVVPANTYFYYKNVNFGSTPIRSLTLNYAVPNDTRYSGSTVNFYIDSKSKSAPDFSIVIQPTTTNTTEWYEFKDISYPIPADVVQKFSGIHDLYMVTTRWAAANFMSAKFSETYKQVTDATVTLTKDGNAVNSLGEADTVKASASVFHFDGKGKNITLMLGIYDENNSLVMPIQYDTKANVDETKEDFSVEINLPSDKKFDTCYAAALLFEKSNDEFNLYHNAVYAGENKLKGTSTDKSNTVKIYDSTVKLCFDFNDDSFGKGTLFVRPSSVAPNDYSSYLLAGTANISDGVLSADITVPERFLTDDYDVYVVKDGETKKYEKLFYYTNQSDVTEALDIVKNSSTDGSTLKNCLNNSKVQSGEYVKKLLAIEETLDKINNAKDKDGIYKGIADYMKQYGDTMQKKSEFVNCANAIYAQAMFYTGMSPSKITDEYYEALEIADKAAYTKYYKNTDKAAFDAKFAVILKNADKITNNQTFLNVFELTQALCSLEEAVAWGTVDSVFNDFDRVLELSKLAGGKNLSSYNELSNTLKKELCDNFLSDAVFNSKSDVQNTFQNKYPSSQQPSSDTEKRSKSSSGGSSMKMSGVTPDTGDITTDNTDTNNKDFDDLSGFEWAKESVKALTDKGIISGTGNNKFNPGGNIKREEFTKLVVCLFGIENDTADTNFADVDKNMWYSPYISAAYKNNIVMGRDSLFGVGENITREDACVILYRACTQLKRPVSTTNKSISFVDTENISDYARDAVTALARAEIVNGFENGCFEPKNYITRAESAKLIYALMNADYKDPTE